jgi:type VI secretion system TssN-like protein
MDTIANDTNKIMMILGIATVGLSALFSKLVEKVKGSVKPYIKTTIIYSLIALLFFAAIGFTAHPDIFTDHLSFFVFYQAYFFLFGLMHFHMMHRVLRWSGDDSAFAAETVFTMILCLAGSICFLLVYQWTSIDGMVPMMLTSCYVFILPGFIYQTFRQAIAIPPKIIKQWQYPFDQTIVDPDEAKFKNLLVISFEFQKQTNDNHFTNFRAKAPADMEFGELFYFFLNDYNERHPNSAIGFVSSKGEPHQWIFYKKPKWHSVLTQYIDTDKTIYNNKIRENDVIICSRSLAN